MNNGTIARLVIADGLRRYRDEAVYTLALCSYRREEGWNHETNSSLVLGRVFLFLKRSEQLWWM
ncbi:hypothetical protein JS44_12025 [Anoxybacillus flavithermus]|uniref:Uncharacterized protein n=1 Tax=Anoxybacillus flavithermus TaxID=33934 RepID=A0A094IXA1_9BACL|nr:hypothetical protein JS44_12025 [Anoxybacillus flavithermus]